MAETPSRTLLEQLRQWIRHPIQSLTQQRHQPEAYRQWLTINTEGPVQMEQRQGVTREAHEPSNLASRNLDALTETTYAKHAEREASRQDPEAPMPARGTPAYVERVVQDAIRTGYEEGYPLRADQITNIRNNVWTQEMGNQSDTHLRALRHEHYAQEERERDAANEAAQERVRERHRERGREMER